MSDHIDPDKPGAQAGRGRLAQVIATRGGLAAPEAPFVIEHREALIYMLCEAAELEHGIMCQYLFAAFSLKQSTDEGLTEAELAAVTRWRKQISHVATQEMLHLALVHNLLSAIGAAPHLARPNFPAPGQPLSGRGPADAAAVRRAGAPALHVPGAPRGHGPRRRRGPGHRRPGARRSSTSATSFRRARTSRRSGICTGRSSKGSPIWRRSTASAGCSPARRGRRRPSRISAGRS